MEGFIGYKHTENTDWMFGRKRQIFNPQYTPAIMDVAIIGAGTIGRRLSRSFRACEQTEVTHVVDIDEHKARELADELGAKYSTDYTKIMDNVDIVYVGVPPAYHAQITIDALKSGRHVICEKPIAATTEDGLRMVKAAESSKSVTAINLPFRFSPALEYMKETLDTGTLGQLKYGELRFRFPKWPRKWQNVEWLKYREQGGPLREVGTHYFFALFELFSNVKRVMAFTDFGKDNACETQSLGIIETDQGLVTLNLITGGMEDEENTLYLYFDQGVLKFAKWYHLSLQPKNETLVEDRVNAELEMVKTFVKAVKGDRKAEEKLVSFRDALDAQKVLDAVYRSNGQWIDL